mmetsp:Transcript_19441/g.29885  ORF Transcript_19441/g.29885 Transcript_19441/m.29885 type:complete len:159 (-) Transcript_19441:877-1353(-)
MLLKEEETNNQIYNFFRCEVLPILKVCQREVFQLSESFYLLEGESMYRRVSKQELAKAHQKIRESIKAMKTKEKEKNPLYLDSEDEFDAKEEAPKKSKPVDHLVLQVSAKQKAVELVKILNEEVLTTLNSFDLNFSEATHKNYRLLRDTSRVLAYNML